MTKDDEEILKRERERRSVEALERIADALEAIVEKLGWIGESVSPYDEKGRPKF